MNIVGIGGASFAIYNAVKEANRLLELSPIMKRKAQKNDMEIQGMENANIRDAVAVIAFSAELEMGIAAGEDWDEIKVEKKLEEYRSKDKLYKANPVIKCFNRDMFLQGSQF